MIHNGLDVILHTDIHLRSRYIAVIFGISYTEKPVRCLAVPYQGMCPHGKSVFIANPEHLVQRIKINRRKIGLRTGRRYIVACIDCRFFCNKLRGIAKHCIRLHLIFQRNAVIMSLDMRQCFRIAELSQINACPGISKQRPIGV